MDKIIYEAALTRSLTLRENIEVLQNCLSFKKSFGCIYTETAFKDLQNA